MARAAGKAPFSSSSNKRRARSSSSAVFARGGGGAKKPGLSKGPKLPESLGIDTQKDPSNGRAQRRRDRRRGTDDLYEFEEEDQLATVRRSKIGMEFDREEIMDESGRRFGGDGDDEEEGDLGGGGDSRGNGRAKLLGELADGERVDSDDDEEVDSDEAFEESDEERFAGFFDKPTARSPKKKGQKTKAPTTRRVHFNETDIDLNEDSDSGTAVPPISQKAPFSRHKNGGGGVAMSVDDVSEEEEEEIGDEEDFVDLLDILDGKAKPFLASDGDENIEGPSSSKEKTKEDDTLEALKQFKSNQQFDSDAEDFENEGQEVFQGHIAASDSNFNSDTDQPESDGSAADDDDAEPDNNSAFAPSDDEDASAYEGALEGLHTFISGLDPGTRKRKVGKDGVEGSDDELAPPSRPRKRRFIQEQGGGGLENEFGATSKGGKLRIEDLLAPLSSSATGPNQPPSAALFSLKKSTKALVSSSAKSQALSAPLPQRAQEKLDRQAAYEQTKEEVDKWSDTMKRIREAEHLSFPLQAPGAPRVSNLELAAKFKPSTALESSVSKLLKSAGLAGDKDITATEEEHLLKTNKLSIHEVAARRAELRKMRDLALRAELKARRANKIKSKTYRKLRRKEKQRLKEKIDDIDEDDDEGERMKVEIERARERATLKHKNTGKWAKQMKHRTMYDEEGGTRKDVEDMLERGEKLRRQIRGLGSDDESGGEELSGSGEEPDETAIKQSAFDELRALEKDGAEDQQGDGEMSAKKKANSIFEMKFMKDAMREKELHTSKMVDDFVKEMGGDTRLEQEGEISEDGGKDEDETPAGVVAVRAGGRIVYRPSDGVGKKAARDLVRPVGSLASDTSSVTLKSTDLLTPPPSSPEAQKRQTVPLPDNDDNPWLSLGTPPSSTLKVISSSAGDVLPVTTAPALADKIRTTAPRKHNEVVVGRNSSTMEKSKNRMKKVMRKLEGGKQKAADDAAMEVDMSQSLILKKKASTTLADKSPSNSTERNEEAGLQTKATGPSAEGGDDDDDANSEVDAQENLLQLKGKGQKAHVNGNGVQAFQQRDLVALAFAGDNVVQQFEAQKQSEINDDAPTEVDTTLPGWGSWGGSGIRKKAPNPKYIKKIAGIAPTDRADHGKAHVIISERKDKKAAKYLVKDLPYPYASVSQFNRAMERPIGKEWNTRVGFQRGTLPRVVKKMGVVIDPLKKHT